MEITVRVATILLKKADPPLASTRFTLEVPEGLEVRGLIDTLSMPAKLVGSVTINKKRQPMEAVIAPGDVVAIIPAISGG